MVYVMSDLHGRYDLYTQMLEKIRFSDKDSLYILGDVVDRGPDGIKILLDICDRKNISFICGNHDYIAMSVLACLYSEDDGSISEDEMAAMIQLWRSDGGDPTIQQFLEVSTEDKVKALQCISKARLFQEIELSGTRYFLSHTVPEKEKMMDLKKCDPQSFLEDRPQYDRVYFEDKYVVTGHTPTVTIGEQYKGRIYRENNHIAVDCGAAFGFGLGCICLDNGEEFYV